jgi:hypothetical protein
VNAVGVEVEAIAQAGRRISTDTSQLIAGVRAGRGTIGKLVTDDELYVRAVTIARETETAVRVAREAAQRARAAIDDVRATIKEGGGPSEGIVADLQHTLKSTREVMSDLEENTKALKRNILFRGYFKDRGYYDLEEISAIDYRAGALAGDHRRPIRIWMRADLLFERTAQVEGARDSARTSDAGDLQEVLSSGGRVRLDAAMAELLRYPRTTPIVIEGYAEGETRDERHRLASERALQVRDYLISRYEDTRDRLAVMPLGREANGSPRGETWDGIGLAAWVDERVLQR